MGKGPVASKYYIVFLCDYVLTQLSFHFLITFSTVTRHLKETNWIATYLFSHFYIETRFGKNWRPQLDVVINARGGQQWQERMRLQAVHHVVVRLQQHHQLCRLPVPDEHVATVRATQNVIVSPEGCLLDHGPAKISGVGVGHAHTMLSQCQLSPQQASSHTRLGSVAYNSLLY